MKGLAQVPSTESLVKAYRRLQGAEKISEEDFVLCSQWVRFDPRLGEIWVARFLQEWKNLRFGALCEAIRHQPWPLCLGVLIDQILDHSLLGQNVVGSDRRDLARLRDALLRGQEKAN